MDEKGIVFDIGDEWHCSWILRLSSLTIVSLFQGPIHVCGVVAHVMLYRPFIETK
jgi:hypothetical protein